ncbi:MAG: serine protease [Planctomycetota bacterium]|nr:serine protease [Planctomycetota bacterium]
MKDYQPNRAALAIFVAMALLWSVSISPMASEQVATAEAVSSTVDHGATQPQFVADLQDELDVVINSEVSDFEIAPETSPVAELSSQILEEERARIMRELDLTSDGLKRWVDNEIDQTHQKIEALDSRIEARIDAMGPAKSPAQRQYVPGNHRNKVERMIYPVVQLRGNGTVGSGVVVSSDQVDENQWATWIVTAYHVVEEVRDFSSEKVVVREIRFFDPELGRLGSEIHEGVEIASLPASDLSLVRVLLTRQWSFLAEPATEKACLQLSVFDTVYAVGCPLGNQPLPTIGEISSQYKPVADEVFWMVSAPTFFGNSGGGIFLAGDGRLVGISSMIYTYGKRSPMVVPHMGLFVPLQTVRSWLRREGFAHLMGDPGPMTPVPATSSPEEAKGDVSGSF